MRTAVHHHTGTATTGMQAQPMPMRPAIGLQTARAVPAPDTSRVSAHDISRVPIADIVQRKAARGAKAQAYRPPNRSGLPDRLKAGVEALSGLSMDRVRVHFGSPEPEQLRAHAFTRGTDIHLAPGQERHLAHEAWHVVQQAERRVRPTTTVAGNDVNDETGLEREADALGAASAAHGASLLATGPAGRAPLPDHQPVQAGTDGACVQRVIKISDGTLKGKYDKPGAKTTKGLIASVKDEIGDELARGWVKWIAARAGKTKRYDYTTGEFLDELKSTFPKKSSGSKIRPNFPKSSYWLGSITREIQTGEDQSDLKPSEENLALPHRFPYKAIETSTQLFLSGKEDATDLFRWTGRLIDATKERRDLNAPEITTSAKRKRYEKAVDEQLDGMEQARKKLKTEVESGKNLDLTSSTTQEFLKYTNALHGNIPDYGPHAGVNIQVSDRTHLHVEEDGTLTPGSLAAGSMSPHRGKGVALTSDGKSIVTTGGYKFDPDELSKKLRQLLDKRGYDKTTIDEDDLEEY